jgi:hypothetical protein
MKWCVPCRIHAVPSGNRSSRAFAVSSLTIYVELVGHGQIKALPGELVTPV